MAQGGRSRSLQVFIAIVAAGLLLLIAVWSVRPAADETSEGLRAGAAISLRPAMEEIAAAWEAKSGRRLEFSYGSSGQVASQIAGGAPIDLFISAAHLQVDQLAAGALIDPGSRRVIATNALVLIVPAGAEDPPESFADLAGKKGSRLAIGEPRTVPAGLYAQQVLEHLGLADSLRGRLVYGTNVRQVLAYVERGEVDAGIVYRTDAMMAGERVRVVATAAREWHAPIEYPGVAIAGSGNVEAARAFLEFLSTAEARQVLEAHGFGAPGPRPATGSSRE